jgi:ribonuclease T1
LVDFKNNEIEILVFVEAYDEHFSNTVKTKTSYIADDIVDNSKFILMYRQTPDKQKTLLEINRINEFEILNLMMKKYSQFIIGMLLGLIVGFFLGKMMVTTNQVVQSFPNATKNYATSEKKLSNKSTFHEDSNTENNYSANDEIPEKVYTVLKYIKEHHEAPEGYVGGREFKNRENQLPMFTNDHEKIKYQEWDINPKIEGQNRGKERLVIGDDERNWFTNNHYKTFTQIKNK